MTESFEEMKARAKRLYSFILKSYRDQRVLVVSHSTFLQQFHGVPRGQDWLEALGTSVGNLELATFHLAGEKVISEERAQLTDRKQVRF
jgi:broad specificity phosphatase PhoE